MSTRWPPRSAIVILTAYAATVTAANGASSLWPPVGVAGLQIPAGAFFAGLAFALRDLLQDAIGARTTLLAIAAGAALSGLIAAPRIALASAAAFAVSELADFAVYTPLRHRSRVAAVGLSNALGLLVDSLVFLPLALRETSLLDGLTAFLTTQVFGHYRHQLLNANLKTLDEKAHRERHEKITALRRSIADTDAKCKRLVRSLEMTDGVDQGFIRDINERRAELRSQKQALQQHLAEVEDEVHRAPNPTLLDYLPITPIDLTELPDELVPQAVRGPPPRDPLRLQHPHRDLPHHTARRHHQRRRPGQQAGYGHPLPTTERSRHGEAT